MARAERATLGALTAYFLKLGALGFGGPIALAGYMERDLVEERGWISEQDYKQGLALAQLAPGPMAAQLAIYLGYAHSGVLGATLAALAFIGPSFVMVVALAALYERSGGLPWVRAAFYGIGAAAMAIIARSAWKLAQKTVGDKKLSWALFVVMAALTAATGKENPALFALSGLLAVAVYAPPAWLRPRALPAADPATLWALAAFFTKASCFVFGSGLAILPYLYGGAVRDFHWLTERQFLDAVAVAMITPGPVVITVVFVGYLVAGLAGACVAALGVFAPVYLVVVLLAGWFRRHSAHPVLKAFVSGVTASAVGALTGAALVLARGALVDWTTLAIFVSALAALLRLKTPEPAVVLAAGLAGLVLYRG